MPNGFASFAEGFTDAFQAAQKQRTLRQQLQLEREESEREAAMQERRFGLDVLQFENQLTQQERAGQLDERRLGIQEGEFELNQQRFQLEQQQAETQRLQQEKRLEFERRRLDQQALTMLTNLENVPKAARKTFLRQLAPNLGIDPKSDEFKGMVDAIGALDPEELNRTTGMIKSIFPKLPAGQAAAFSLGVISGKITLNEAMSFIREQQVVAARTRGGSLLPEFDPGSNRLTDPTPIEEQQPGGQQPSGEQQGAIQATPESLRQRSLQLTQEAEAAARRGDEEFATRLESQAGQLRQMADDMVQAREFDPAEVERRAVAEETGKRRAERRQPLNNRVKSILGLQGAGEISVGEFSDLGGFSDVAGSKDLPELSETKAKAQRSIERIDKLATAVAGREELLGLPGATIRFLDNVASGLQALPNLYSYVTRGRENAFLKSQAVQGWAVDSGLAAESATIRSQVIGLAYDIAQAQEEGRLSDQDIQRFREQIGEAGSSEQFVAVLNQLREQLRGTTISQIEAATGMRPIDMLNPDELDSMIEETEDPRMLKAIIVTMKRNLARQKNGGR